LLRENEFDTDEPYERTRSLAKFRRQALKNESLLQEIPDQPRAFGHYDHGGPDSLERNVPEGQSFNLKRKRDDADEAGNGRQMECVEEDYVMEYY
jgi:hypothetical protein